MEILFKINEKITITNPVFILKKVVIFLIDLKSCKVPSLAKNVRFQQISMGIVLKVVIL